MCIYGNVHGYIVIYYNIYIYTYIYIQYTAPNTLWEGVNKPQKTSPNTISEGVWSCRDIYVIMYIYIYIYIYMVMYMDILWYNYNLYT